MTLRLVTGAGIVSKSSYANCQPEALFIIYLSDLVSLNKWNGLLNKYEQGYFSLLQHLQCLSSFVLAAVESVFSFDPDPT